MAALVLTGVLLVLSLPTATSAPRTVSFDDANLRACVAENLGQPPRLPITVDQARSVTSLVCEQTVAGLGGIEALRNLRTLDLVVGNRIHDLAPLAGLTRLEELVADQGSIRDLSPLRGLSRLTRLDLGSNPVASLSPLASLTGLRDLTVGGGGSSFTSLAPLRHLALTSLWVGDAAWTTLEPIRGKRSLETLGLSQEHRAVDVAALGTLNGLRDLSLALPSRTDLTPLGRLTGLRTLDLGPEARDLALLRPLRRLQVLSAVLSDGDGSVLAGKPDLRELTLGAPALRDLGALRTSPRLTRLVVAGGRLRDVSGLRGHADLSEVLLTGVDHADLSPLSRLPTLELLSVTDSRLDPLRGFGSGFRALTDLELRDDRITSLRGFRVPPRLSALDVSGNALADLGSLRCGLLVNALGQRVTAARALPGRPFDLRLRSVPGQRVRIGSGSRWTVSGTTITYARPGKYRVSFTSRDDPGTTCEPGVGFDGVVTQRVVDARPVRPPRDR